MPMLFLEVLQINNLDVVSPSTLATILYLYAKYNLKIFGLANDINNNNISTKITIIEIDWDCERKGSKNLLIHIPKKPAPAYIAFSLVFLLGFSLSYTFLFIALNVNKIFNKGKVMKQIVNSISCHNVLPTSETVIKK